MVYLLLSSFSVSAIAQAPTTWMIVPEMSEKFPPKALDRPTPSSEDIAQLRALACTQAAGAMRSELAEYQDGRDQAVRVRVRVADSLE